MKMYDMLTGIASCCMGRVKSEKKMLLINPLTQSQMQTAASARSKTLARVSKAEP